MILAEVLYDLEIQWGKNEKKRGHTPPPPDAHPKNKYHPHPYQWTLNPWADTPRTYRPTPWKVVS